MFNLSMVFLMGEPCVLWCCWADLPCWTQLSFSGDGG
jgi:hypothetical protein